VPAAGVTATGPGILLPAAAVTAALRLMTQAEDPA